MNILHKILIKITHFIIKEFNIVWYYRITNIFINHKKIDVYKKELLIIVFFIIQKIIDWYNIDINNEGVIYEKMLRKLSKCDKITNNNICNDKEESEIIKIHNDWGDRYIYRNFVRYNFEGQDYTKQELLNFGEYKFSDNLPLEDVILFHDQVDIDTISIPVHLISEKSLILDCDPEVLENIANTFKDIFIFKYRI